MTGQTILCLVVLTVMTVRRKMAIFPFVGALLGVQTIRLVVGTALMFHRRALHVDLDRAYNLIFFGGWTCETIEAILQVLIIYSIFSEAMRPMAGLHRAGKIIFRWVAVVSGLVAFSLAAGPEMFSSAASFGPVIEHLRQGISVLTLCLLVFVCFATRSLGLTFRSHIFGVSLGLGIASTVDLTQAAWLVTVGASSIYSPVYLVSAVGFCIAFAVWGVYFALPEPARRMILLPTTSPFFFWNRISEILGDAPGQVAVAGFKPEMLAPAELEMLTAATSREIPPGREPETGRSMLGGSGLRSDRTHAPRPYYALSR